MIRNFPQKPPLVALSTGLCAFSLWGATTLAATPVTAAPSSTAAIRAIPHEPPINIFNSPDGALVVWSTEGHGGVVISVQDKNKHELASEGHYPEDRPGGFGFAQGAWTADSLYFVYSTGAWGDSLRTQPIFSIYVYSRTKNAFLSLGNRFGLLGTAKFELTPPDVIEIEVVDAATHSTKKVTMHLSELK